MLCMVGHTYFNRLTIMQDEARASWTSDDVVSYLPYLSVYAQILTDRPSWSGPQPVPTDDQEFVSITHMSKQCSPILIVHQSSANATPLPHVCRRHRHDRRCHHELLYHVCIISGLMRMWLDHIPHSFILQSDLLLKILRGNGRQNIQGNATRPLSWFFGQGLGTRLNIWLLQQYRYSLQYQLSCMCTTPPTHLCTVILHSNSYED